MCALPACLPASRFSISAARAELFILSAAAMHSIYSRHACCIVYCCGVVLHATAAVIKPSMELNSL